MPRGPRLDAPGTLHHVILRGIERKRIIKNTRDQDDFVGLLGEKARDTGTIIYAWALMTNHAHILLRSGTQGMSTMMRKFLSGYAIRYNLRNRRHGHLFQNRYKSIVCEEDPYFLQLVRYIHLNPLRAGLVRDMRALDSYAWTGHSAIMGSVERTWQDTAMVLRQFGRKVTKARRAYQAFVADGIEEGRRSELVGGGLVRSMGGWSEVLSMKRTGQRERSDERILGSGAFVEQILKEAEEGVRRQLSPDDEKRVIQKVKAAVCRQRCVGSREIEKGNKRREVAAARAEIVLQLVKEEGISMAATARAVGVSTSAVSKLLTKNRS